MYKPLSVPENAWEDLSMDFIMALPRTPKGNDSIMVVVGRFSKITHFIRCKKIDDAFSIAQLFYDEIVQIHGLPKSIVLDRDSKFLSHFWKSLWRLLGTKLMFSNSHHPQTDGQTEVVNRIFGTLLRSLVSKGGRNWDVKLAYVAYNRTPSRTTKDSPFEVVYDDNPYMPIDFTTLPMDKFVYDNAKEHFEIMLNIHKQIRKQIEKENEEYKKQANKNMHGAKKFEVGDLVWVHFPKERFPSPRKH